MKKYRGLLLLMAFVCSINAFRLDIFARLLYETSISQRWEEKTNNGGITQLVPGPENERRTYVEEDGSYYIENYIDGVLISIETRAADEKSLNFVKKKTSTPTPAPNSGKSGLTPETIEALKREQEEESRRAEEAARRDEAERQAEKARQEAEKAAAEAARQEAERQAEAARKEAERIAAEKARIEAENKAKEESERNKITPTPKPTATPTPRTYTIEEMRELARQALEKTKAEKNNATPTPKVTATPKPTATPKVTIAPTPTPRAYTIEEMRELARQALEKAKAEKNNAEPTPKVTATPKPTATPKVIATPTTVAENKKEESVLPNVPSTRNDSKTSVSGEKNRDSSIDESIAKPVIDAFRQEHPTGQMWTNDDIYTTSYKNEKGIYTFLNARGCAGFAYNLSDNIYGQGTPAITIFADDKNDIVSQVKKYDIVHLNGGTHYVIVLNVDSKGNAIVAEANVGGKVRWDSIYNLNTSDVMSITRRIPEEKFQAEEVKSSYNPYANIAKTTDAEVDPEAVTKLRELLNEKLREMGYAVN